MDRAGKAIALDDERAAAEFLMANARLVSAGFEHYEVSSAALPGHRSRHNSAYWRRAPFIGLGPSAHSGFAGAALEPAQLGGVSPAGRGG